MNLWVVCCLMVKIHFVSLYFSCMYTGEHEWKMLEDYFWGNYKWTAMPESITYDMQTEKLRSEYESKGSNNHLRKLIPLQPLKHKVKIPFSLCKLIKDLARCSCHNLTCLALFLIWMLKTDTDFCYCSTWVQKTYIQHSYHK